MHSQTTYYCKRLFYVGIFGKFWGFGLWRGVRSYGFEARVLLGRFDTTYGVTTL